jgi:hypothetical protein
MWILLMERTNSEKDTVDLKFLKEFARFY